MTVTKEMIEAGLRITLSSVNMPAGECLHETDVREILEAALSRSAEAGKPVVKGVDEVALDRAAREGYAVRCKTHGPRVLEQYASPDIMQMQLNDARVIVSAYLSALSTPADIDPVLFVSEQQLASCIGTYLPTRKEREGNFQFPLYASPMGSCEPEDWHCSARQQGTAGGSDPADCDWPLCGCDPHADRVIAALDEIGYAAPVADSEPVSVPEGWTLRHDNFKRWCIFGPDDRWYMQPVGMITADEARIICECASALAAAPQPNPSKVDASAVIERCAQIAETFGPSRPIVSVNPDRLVIGRWEGEQAASLSIAASIRALAAQGEKQP
ncbi:hypothetical protein E5S70_17495 [Ensifer adhaerens]|uniref:hypothetical protein n=1 Tax=Ensifer canadensis TaxID=555315 RepID=UPI001490827A|nr:hypothetical protein [Ensifer canadensis]NOV17848.1 hypothetical protein [Ensifer canadensis]